MDRASYGNRMTESPPEVAVENEEFPHILSPT